MTRSIDNDVDSTRSLRVANAAGRVEVDSRGHSVWRWAKEVIDSTSVLLKRLENKDLSLEPTQKVPVAGKAPAAAAKPDRAKRAAELRLAEPHGRDIGGGFDPYNSR